MADLQAFLDNPRSNTHEAYAQSALAPAAPEYSVGDVLVGSAYRTLVLSVRDNYVEGKYLEGMSGRVAAVAANTEARRVAAEAAWTALLDGPGGMASPRLLRQKRERRLIPLVPEVARYTGVMGTAAARRWQPGNLLMSAIWSGAGPDDAPGIRDAFRDALHVGDGDDLLARYINRSLEIGRHPDEVNLTAPAPSLKPDAPLWRLTRATPLAPPERFAIDLPVVAGLKGRLTRRQWVLLVEAHLRLGMSMYVLWLCRTNVAIWRLCRDALTGSQISRFATEAALWPAPPVPPLITAPGDPDTSINALLSQYAIARLGINLILHAMSAPDSPKVGESSGGSPADSIAVWLGQIRSKAGDINAAIQQAAGKPFTEAMTDLVDSQSELLEARGGTTTNNMAEFLRHVMTQLSTYDPDERSFDQAYVAAYASPRKRTIRLSPVTLLLLVHLAQHSVGDVPATIGDLQQHVAEYGIGLTGSELRSGGTARTLEAEGLVVDSPDAAGGRLLVDALRGVA